MKRVNLLPKEIEGNKSALRDRFIFIFLGLALLAWLVLSFYGQEILIAGTRVRIARKKEDIQQLQIKLDQAKSLYAKIQDERKKINASRKGLSDRLVLLKELREERMVPSNVLLELSERIPLQIRLLKASVDDDELLLAGEALDNMTVGHFMAQLDGSNLFERTSFHYIEKKAVEGKLPFIEFELITHLSR